MAWSRDEAVFARDSLNRKELTLYREKFLAEVRESVSSITLTDPDYLAALIIRVRNAEQADLPYEKQWVVGQFVTAFGFELDAMWRRLIARGDLHLSERPDDHEYVVFNRETILGCQKTYWGGLSSPVGIEYRLLKEVKDVESL